MELFNNASINGRVSFIDDSNVKIGLDGYSSCAPSPIPTQINVDPDGELIIHPEVTIHNGVVINVRRGGKLVICKSANIKNGCYIECVRDMYIGKHTTISHHCTITDCKHHFTYTEGEMKNGLTKMVVISDGAWIGMQSTIIGSEVIGTLPACSQLIFSKHVGKTAYCNVNYEASLLVSDLIAKGWRVRMMKPWDTNKSKYFIDAVSGESYLPVIKSEVIDYLMPY